MRRSAQCRFAIALPLLVTVVAAVVASRKLPGADHIDAPATTNDAPADINDLFRRAAGYVDRILRGEKAAELPIQLPTRFELVVNVKTARALNVTMPPSILVRADEVIE